MQAKDDVVELHRDRETPAEPLSFETLFLDQHDRLYRALYFVTGSSADAEELMQDAFLKLWERWDRLDTIEDPAAYLFRVALNGVRMRARRARVAARRIVPIAGSRDPFDDVHLRENVRRMLRRISPRQRTAIVLTEIRSANPQMPRSPVPVGAGLRPSCRLVGRQDGPGTSPDPRLGHSGEPASSTGGTSGGIMPPVASNTISSSIALTMIVSPARNSL